MVAILGIECERRVKMSAPEKIEVLFIAIAWAGFLSFSQGRFLSPLLSIPLLRRSSGRVVHCESLNQSVGAGV